MGRILVSRWLSCNGAGSEKRYLRVVDVEGQDRHASGAGGEELEDGPGLSDHGRLTDGSYPSQ